MPHFVPISVIIPTLNEAENIAATLASAKNVEIIIVDAGSCDNTVKIAKAWGRYIDSF